MIPKTIYYVWFGGKKPDSVISYINTWKKTMPDYNIIEINEEHKYFKEIYNNNKFFTEVYNRQLWAFASDYMRCYALYKNGGIYLDTDVETIKPFDKFLNHKAFIGLEDNSFPNIATFGAEKGSTFLKKVLDFYEDKIWKSDLYVVPTIIQQVLKDNYNLDKFLKLKDGVEVYKTAQTLEIINLDDITIYPNTYFYPYEIHKDHAKELITENTHSIHMWHATWSKDKKLDYLKYKHLTNTQRILFKTKRKILKIISYFIPNKKLRKKIRTL